MIQKNITNKQFLLGDFDKDGISNIDDKRPFDPRNNQRVNKEVSLAQTIRYIQKKRIAARKVASIFAKKNNIKKIRIKDTYSTINKAVRRNPSITNDFIGFRVEANKREEIKKRWDDFNKRNKIKKRIVFVEKIETDNKYKTNQGTGNPYRAMHSNFLLNGFGVEAQFRTKKYGKLNDQMHMAYKQKKNMKPFIKKGKILIKKGF